MGKHFNPLPPHGGRHTGHFFNTVGIVFQSTPSAWRETCENCKGSGVVQHFNPLPPHGGRRRLRHNWKPLPLFQSTPSAWRETLFCVKMLDNIRISIHSLRMEGDFWYAAFRYVPGRFQSTPSAWRETYNCLQKF